MTNVLRSITMLSMLGLAGAALGRVAPNPLPAWSSLSPADTNQVMYDVSDLIGNYLLLGQNQDKHVYVWDIALAQLSTGTKVIYRYEFQTPSGSYGAFDASNALPSGTTILTSLSAVFGSANTVFTDSDGVMRIEATANFATGEISSGGAVSLNPGHVVGPGRSTCGITGVSWACGASCGWSGGSCFYSEGGWCYCSVGSCNMIVGGVSCGGSCGENRSCQGDGTSSGCGCQG